MDGHFHHIALHFERVAFGLLHEIGDGGAGGARRHVELRGRLLAGPFIDAEDETPDSVSVVFGLLDGGEDDIFRRD